MPYFCQVNGTFLGGYAVEHAQLVVAEDVAGGDPPDLREVVPEPPGEDARGDGRRDPDAPLVAIPGDLVAAVPQDGAVDLGLPIELLQAVLLVYLVQQLLGLVGVGHVLLCGLIQGVAGGSEPLHQVAGGLVDRYLGVVEHELPGA